MTMRMSVGQLRRAILREMKLGIAGGQDDARSWGEKPLPDDPPAYEPPEGGETYIATDVPNFEPDRETIDAWNAHVLAMQKRGAAEPWDPDPAEAIGPDDQNGDRPTRPRRMEARQLRDLIHEELAAEPDPFAQPKKPDLKGLTQKVLQAEEVLGSMPQVICTPRPMMNTRPKVNSSSAMCPLWWTRLRPQTSIAAPIAPHSTGAMTRAGQKPTHWSI